MKEKLTSLENHLERINAPVLKFFHPPLSDKNILTEFIYKHWGGDVIIPSELIDIYKWHNGTNNAIAQRSSVKGGYFADHLSLNELTEVSQIISGDTFYDFIKNNLFPFCTSFNGEYLSVSLDQNQKLIYCSTSDFEIESMVSMYDDLNTFLDSTIAFYDNGCLIINGFDTVGLDYDKYDEYMAIGEEMNPESDYWRVKREFQENE